MTDKLFCFRISEKFLKSLRELSREEEKPISYIIRDSLREYIRKKGPSK